VPIWSRGAAAGNELIAQLPQAGQQRYAAQITAAQATPARSAQRGPVYPVYPVYPVRRTSRSASSIRALR